VTAPSGQRLTLTEELVVLSFRRDTRKRTSRSIDPSGSLMVMFRAALIIELIELGRVGLVAQQDTRPGLTTFGLRALSSESTGTAATDGLLAEIASGRRSGKALSWWLHDGNTMRAVTDELVGRGVVAERSADRLQRAQRLPVTDVGPRRQTQFTDRRTERRRGRRRRGRSRRTESRPLGRRTLRSVPST